MNTEAKEQAVLLAREIHEAMETLDVALGGRAEEKEIIEAKNIVANALRSFKSFFENLSGDEKKEAHDIFSKKIESLVSKARQLH
jgi:hypothetical protein